MTDQACDRITPTEPNPILAMIWERYGLSREDILQHQAEYLRRRDELRRRYLQGA